MKATILNSPPLSGSIKEFHFECIDECTFVKFEPDDNESWVGVFGKGDIEYKDVAINRRFAFVISGGFGYYIDLESRTLLYHDDNWLVGVVNSDDDEMFVAFSCHEVHLYSKECRLWSSERIALDEISNVKVVGNEIIGEAWANGYFEFRINLITKEVTGNSPLGFPI